jgi:hypothetical protein
VELDGQFHAPISLPPENELAFLFELEEGWSPEPVWTLGRTEKFLASAGNQKMFPPFSSLYPKLCTSYVIQSANSEAVGRNVIIICV